MSSLKLNYTVMPIENDNYHVIVRCNQLNFLVKKSFARDEAAVRGYLAFYFNQFIPTKYGFLSPSTVLDVTPNETI